MKVDEDPFDQPPVTFIVEQWQAIDHMAHIEANLLLNRLLGAGVLRSPLQEDAGLSTLSRRY